MTVTRTFEKVAGVALLLAAAWLLLPAAHEGARPKVPGPSPCPGPVPSPAPPSPPRPKPPRPRPRPGPWDLELTRVAREANAAVAAEPIGKISVGGPVGPDGKAVVQVDFPVELRTKNVGGSDGAGLCVFTSIGHAARWQNERRLVDFQSRMRSEPGGGWPGKVDSMIAKYGKGTQYVQYEGADTAILRQALAGGRMPCVTYDGHDPHYSGQIAHMVNLVAYTGDDDASDWAVVLDNNFIGETELVWLRPSEFKERWIGGGGGWAVVLLAPPPPAPPHN